MPTATDSTCWLDSSSSGLYEAHPPAVLESCFGWCSVWCRPLTREEVAQRQAELEQRYPGCRVCVSPTSEYVMHRRQL